MKIDISKLRTVKHFADQLEVSPAHIYQMIKKERVKTLQIDGIMFVDIEETRQILPLKQKETSE